jgi:hypothetical protein
MGSFRNFGRASDAMLTVRFEAVYCRLERRSRGKLSAPATRRISLMQPACMPVRHRSMLVIFWCCFVRWWWWCDEQFEFPLPTFQEHTGFSAVMLPGGESSAFLREGENGERPEGKLLILSLQACARPGMEVEDPLFSGPSMKSIVRAP